MIKNKNILILSILTHSFLVLASSVSFQNVQQNPQMSDTALFAQQSMLKQSSGSSRYQQAANQRRRNQAARVLGSTSRSANNQRALDRLRSSRRAAALNRRNTAITRSSGSVRRATDKSALNRLRASIAKKPSTIQRSQPVSFTSQPLQNTPTLAQRSSPIQQSPTVRLSESTSGLSQSRFEPVPWPINAQQNLPMLLSRSGQNYPDLLSQIQGVQLRRPEERALAGSIERESQELAQVSQQHQAPPALLPRPMSQQQSQPNIGQYLRPLPPIPISQQRQVVNPLQNPPALLPRPMNQQQFQANIGQYLRPLPPIPITRQHQVVNPLQNPPALLPRPMNQQQSQANIGQYMRPLPPIPINQQRQVVNPLQNPPALLPRPANLQQNKSEFLPEEAEQNNQIDGRNDLLAQIREGVNLRRQVGAMLGQAGEETVAEPTTRENQASLTALLGAKLAERRGKIEEDEESDFWDDEDNDLTRMPQQNQTPSALLSRSINQQRLIENPLQNPQAAVNFQQSGSDFASPLGDRGNLLAQIRGGVNLRKTGAGNAEKRPIAQEEQAGISKLLSLGLAKLRLEDDENEDDSTDDDSEWED